MGSRASQARLTEAKEPRRDRDRLLYAPAFRRLSTITQVLSPSQGAVIHSRLTQTLKVAQLARRLAEALKQTYPEESKACGLDEQVAEAAALAHDLGHPPFGHAGEEELQRLLDGRLGHGLGFEGNAQSFRIVTKLEDHPSAFRGLGLTRATLDAMLKYPWTRRNLEKKWGAYDSEADDLAFARASHPQDDTSKCIEAEIMDWCDDVAYSVHDLEDFYKAGMIPLDRLLSPTSLERKRFEEKGFPRIIDHEPRWRGLEGELSDILTSCLRQSFDLFQEPYEDSRDSRKTLQQFSSLRISDYLDAVSLNSDSGNGTSVEIEDDAKKEVAVLKELTWQYVIRNPALATVQTGQAQIIRTLFLTYTRDAQKNEGRLLPTEWQERIKDSTVEPYRTVVDFVASLTERQALTLYGRITGHVSEALIEPRGIRM